MDRLDIYFASLAAITLHPGFQRENAYIYTLKECFELAKEMEAIRDADNSSGNNGRSGSFREFVPEFGKPENDKESDTVSGSDVQYSSPTPNGRHGSRGD